MATDFIQIHPMVNRIETVLPYNVHAKIGDKFEIFHQAGQFYTATRHAKIFTNPIQGLYIPINDKKKYFRYIEEKIAVVLGDPMMGLPSKAEIVYSLLTDAAFEALAVHDSVSVIRYRKIAEIFIYFILQSPGAIKAIIPMTSTRGQDHNHFVNVGIYGIALAKEMLNNSGSHNFHEIASGFFLHDIGRFYIPKEIREKNAPLNEEEWEIIRQHPEKGYLFLKEIELLTEETGIIVIQHHERNDGSGYPHKLKGDQIHTYSKICSIADTFDALSSNRPYRNAQSTFKALEIMHNEMKTDFDPKFFRAFVSLFSSNK
jgi:HD-GYP domain-containing protein (c-di-GMP phosphodiesterase class II)